jgi:hypothetical protein
MFEDFDKRISTLTESWGRGLSRRKIFRKTVTGLSAAAVAAALGQFTNIRQAFAAECTCECDDCWANGSPCSGCPTGTGCPSGCSVCTNNACGGWCNYSSGWWVAYNCSNLGLGHGYRVCTDCTCPSGDCNGKCTCLSACICCSCQTPADVEAEGRRLAALSA